MQALLTASSRCAAPGQFEDSGPPPQVSLQPAADRVPARGLDLEVKIPRRLRLVENLLDLHSFQSCGDFPLHDIIGSESEKSHSDRGEDGDLSLLEIRIAWEHQLVNHLHT